MALVLLQENQSLLPSLQQKQPWIREIESKAAIWAQCGVYEIYKPSGP